LKTICAIRDITTSAYAIEEKAFSGCTSPQGFEARDPNRGLLFFLLPFLFAYSYGLDRPCQIICLPERTTHASGRATQQQ
jgi:hypothetical protein